MEDLLTSFKNYWNDPKSRTILIVCMVLPIAFIVLFKVKIFGLNKVVRRARTRVKTVYARARSYAGRSFRRRR